MLRHHFAGRLMISCANVIVCSIMAMNAYCSDIAVQGRTINLHAGILQRTIELADGNATTTSLTVGGQEILDGPAKEFSVTFRHAKPNRRPLGLKPGEGGSTSCRKAGFSGVSDILNPEQQGGSDKVQWVEPVTVEGNRWADIFDVVSRRIVKPQTDVTRLIISARSTKNASLRGVAIKLYYEVYEGYPVIRKWMEITNNSTQWLNLDHLTIDDIALAEESKYSTPLTPAEAECGTGSSVIAFGSKDNSVGIIAVSEIPSAMRVIRENGAMGYTYKYFEWVLGPSETFVSEPVFHYAYSGKVRKTISGVSTPLDRTVEGPYMPFLKRHIGVVSDASPIYAPLWLSWANFTFHIDDAIVREQADIAARAGFVLFQLDDGWQRGRLGTEPDTRKFPDFDATCKYVQSTGMRLGLWVSCFRDPDSKDLKAMPSAQVLPTITRLDGVAMSFASPWRDYYARDLVQLRNRYGAMYFKQDFTNIKYGDIAEGHESRTKKESLLRGLRGLLEAQDTIRRLAPDVVTEMTHEIYWGTPGAPCDVAVLKHAARYHIPPNDAAGCGPDQQVSKEWKCKPNELRKQLIQNCFNARRRFYAHRGLPIYALEYYCAATVNFRGSLTPQVQDRQVCSWLMGAPLVYSGDLASLTEENIERYRRRFEIVKRLQKTYDIYRHFQYSGVPVPTDTDWHWWGKLNKDGCGAVVVVRGNGGEDQRIVNIPWVVAGRKYRVSALFEHKEIGVFTGKALQEGSIEIALPTYSQEILELAPLPSRN